MSTPLPNAASSPSATGPLEAFVPGGAAVPFGRTGRSSPVADASGPFSRHLRLADVGTATGSAATPELVTVGASARLPATDPSANDPSAAGGAFGLSSAPATHLLVDGSLVPITDATERGAMTLETRDVAEAGDAVTPGDALASRTADTAVATPAAGPARAAEGSATAATPFESSPLASPPLARPRPPSAPEAPPRSPKASSAAGVTTDAVRGAPAHRVRGETVSVLGSVGRSETVPVARPDSRGDAATAERAATGRPSPTDVVDDVRATRRVSTGVADASRAGGALASSSFGDGIADGEPAVAISARTAEASASAPSTRGDRLPAESDIVPLRPSRTSGAPSSGAAAGVMAEAVPEAEARGAGAVRPRDAEPAAGSLAPPGADGRRDATSRAPTPPPARIGVRATAPAAEPAETPAATPTAARSIGGLGADDRAASAGRGIAASPVALENVFRAAGGPPTDAPAAAAPAQLGVALVPTPLFASVSARSDVAAGAIAPYAVPLDASADGAGALAAGVRWTFGEGGGRARVNVTPADLGPLTIRVELDGERLSVSIAAAQPAAREALETLAPRLREQLLGDGHAGVDVDVTGGREHARADTGAGGRERRDDGGPPRLESEDGRAGDDDSTTAEETILVRAPERPPRSSIDAWA